MNIEVVGEISKEKLQKVYSYIVTIMIKNGSFEKMLKEQENRK